MERALSLANLEERNLNRSGRLIVNSEKDEWEMRKSRSSIKSPAEPKSRHRESKFKRWLKRTFCGETAEYTTDIDTVKQQSKRSELSVDSWRDALDHQLESRFGKGLPAYVNQAQKAIKKLVSERAFQRQAKQD